MLEPPKIMTVYLWQNDCVMVFDQRGEQMTEYQGRKADVRDKIIRDAPPEAKFYSAVWRVSGSRVEFDREEWGLP